MTPRIGSLFSGYGGLDLAVEAVTGGRTVWRSDIKPAARKLIAHHWPNDPNLGDITKVDWTQVEPVDIITGGFPCTDISAAGKQDGLIRYGDGKTRSGLWAEMCRAVNILRPSLMVAENVRALTSVKADSDVEPCPWCLGDTELEPPLLALGAVLGDLADIGFDAEWCGLPASSVGCCHGRYRIFVAAWPAGNTNGMAWEAPGARGRRSGALDRPGAVKRTVGSDRMGENPVTSLLPTPRAANADARNQTVWARPLDQPQNLENALARVGTDWGVYAAAITRWANTIGRPAPHPTEPNTRGHDSLSPALVEWMMGLPEGHITGVPNLTHAEMLSLGGDGVVPQQAEAALRQLLNVRELVAA